MTPVGAVPCRTQAGSLQTYPASSKAVAQMPHTLEGHVTENLLPLSTSKNSTRAKRWGLASAGTAPFPACTQAGGDSPPPAPSPASISPSQPRASGGCGAAAAPAALRPSPPSAEGTRGPPVLPSARGRRGRAATSRQRGRESPEPGDIGRGEGCGSRHTRKPGYERFNARHIKNPKPSPPPEVTDLAGAWKKTCVTVNTCQKTSLGRQPGRDRHWQGTELAVAQRRARNEVRRVYTSTSGGHPVQRTAKRRPSARASL